MTTRPRPRLPATASLALLLAALAACKTLPAARDASPPPAPAAPGGPAGIPDAALGLSRTGLREIPAPPPFADNASAPGERPALPRAFPGAAPAVPHAIADLLPITRDQNLCMDCHGARVKEPGGPTPVPESHYVDLRRGPGAPGERLAGARHVCVSCHLPQDDVRPLVGNTFAR